MNSLVFWFYYLTYVVSLCFFSMGIKEKKVCWWVIGYVLLCLMFLITVVLLVYVLTTKDDISWLFVK